MFTRLHAYTCTHLAVDNDMRRCYELCCYAPPPSVKHRLEVESSADRDFTNFKKC